MVAVNKRNMRLAKAFKLRITDDLGVPKVTVVAAWGGSANLRTPILHVPSANGTQPTIDQEGLCAASDALRDRLTRQICLDLQLDRVEALLATSLEYGCEKGQPETIILNTAWRALQAIMAGNESGLE